MNEGSYNCSTCDGFGKYLLKWGTGIFIKNDNGDPIKYPCKNCDGSGKVNWIENIFQINPLHLKNDILTIVTLGEPGE